MIVTVPGKRYYPDEMTGFAEAKSAVRMLSDCVIRAYAKHYRRSFDKNWEGDPQKGKSCPVYHDLVSCGLNSVYANALEPYVKGILQSQISNLKNYKSKLEDDISSMYDKLNDIGRQYCRKLAVKDSLVYHAKTGVWRKPYAECTISVDKNGILTGFGLEPTTAVLYEYQVDSQIHVLRRRTSSIFEGILRREQKLAHLEKGIPTEAVFGSRKLFRKKDTTCKTTEDLEVWKDDFDFVRHSSITLGGKAQSINGNFLAKWDEFTHNLVWCLPDGTKAVFPDYLPVYYSNEFHRNLANKNKEGNTVTYTVELRKDHWGREYFLVWASFRIPENPYMNYSRADGIISVDINADCLAWSNVSVNGVRLDGGTIPMPLTGLSANQAKDVIGRAVSVLLAECEYTRKPLAVEALDSKGFYQKQKYGNKKKNRIVSQFAFEKVLQAIYSRAERVSVDVYDVNPSYTSVAGKLAYMRKLGISIHESASYVIGLLALGIYPEVPEEYKPILPKPKKTVSESVVPSTRPEGMPERLYNWEKFHCDWKHVHKALIGIRTHAFYLKVPVLKNKRELRSWFKEHDILHPGTKPKQAVPAPAGG